MLINNFISYNRWIQLDSIIVSIQQVAVQSIRADRYSMPNVATWGRIAQRPSRHYVKIENAFEISKWLKQEAIELFFC
jgi:hypothetical protein